jgi:integrase
LCRDCSYRFSDPEEVKLAKKALAADLALESNILNASRNYVEGSQICAIEAKNLAAESDTNGESKILQSKTNIKSRTKQISEIENAPTTATDATNAHKTAIISAESAAHFDLKGKLIDYAWFMKKAGLREGTIKPRCKLLTILYRRGADLLDPENVKAKIAEQDWCEGRKGNAVDAYSTFLKMVGGSWNPPKYKSIPKLPFVPKETEIDQLIAGCSPKVGAFLQLLKETGARAGEAWRVEWDSIDFETSTIRITPEKNSNPRIFHISQKLVAMIRSLPRTYGKYVFASLNMSVDNFRDTFIDQRKRVATKISNPRLRKIMFKTLRTWKGTMEYHRTKDVLHVMQILGHKNIKNTLIYIQLEEALFKDEIDYVSKVAKTENEACVLIEAGFEFVCDFNGHKLFRKRKY